MSLTIAQVTTAKALIDSFESGFPISGLTYGRVSTTPNDPGNLSYGVAQASLTSGSLYKLIGDYIAARGKYTDDFELYLPRIKRMDKTLSHAGVFIDFLRKAGYDPIMQDIQDRYFAQQYWDPSIVAMNDMEFVLPLTAAVIYDSHIQGAWSLVRDSFATLPSDGEEKWVTDYVNARLKWLENNKNSVLKRTIYRPQTFQTLIKAGNWQLTLPIKVRGFVLDAATLGLQ